MTCNEGSDSIFIAFLDIKEDTNGRTQGKN